MKISIPSVSEQKKIIVKDGITKAVKQLEANLNAPVLTPQSEIAEIEYGSQHMLDKERYEPPHADIVGAYFRHFQEHFHEYNSDAKLAKLIGVSSDRRVREFKQGKSKVPYEIWDRFLVMTGRKPQEVIKVFGYLNGE